LSTFIEKKGIIAITIITLAFLVTALNNLGFSEVPTTTTMMSRGDIFTIELGVSRIVDSAMILIKKGDITLSISTGSPNNWDIGVLKLIQGYYSWQKIPLNEESSCIRFEAEDGGAELVEICFIDIEGERLQIVSINAMAGEGFERLIDEQGKISLPISYMSETYFDEVYFVRAAEDYLNAKDPYENTHPPLGKEIIAAGIAMLGYSPFNWRIMGVIFAALIIPVLYMLGRDLTGSWIWGSVAALLFTLDFMHFTLARIATVDTYVVFFSLVSQVFFLKHLKTMNHSRGVSHWIILLWAIFFGLAFSTKWYALFGLLGQFFLLAALRNRWKKVDEDNTGVALTPVLAKILIIFLGAGGVVYLSTYIPQMNMGYGILDIVREQFFMFGYHYDLAATHPFSSPWYSWPIIYRPVWMSFSEYSTVSVSTIAALGNPAVWWVGIAAVLYCLYKFIRERDPASLFILATFSFQWIPYAFLSRPLFLYHYYINVPILCLATAIFLKEVFYKGKLRLVVLSYILVTVYLFATFYPVISGNPTPGDLVYSLRWFISWIF
jgi:dolichyl-phosphate-mannose-protein mannosyltransferase